MGQKKIFASAILLVALMVAFPAVGLLAGESSTDTMDLSTTESSVLEVYGKLPLLFIENQGQVDEAVRYYVKASGQTVYFTEENIVFDLVRYDLAEADDTADRLVFSLDFLGANSQPAIEGSGKDGAVVNYFIGNDPENWHANVPTYRELVYRDIYPNIDLRLYGGGGMLRYDFVVNPGATPEAIALAYSGIDSLAIMDDELVIGTAFGDIVQSPPYIYQQIGDEVVEVGGGFRLGRDNTYGFHVTAYNNQYPLIIDPVLLDYSTYLGGTYDDGGNGIVVDSDNHAYVTGMTWSSTGTLPITPDAFQPAYAGNGDAFATKLSPAGDALVYSTYLGGSDDDDKAYGIAVDSNNHAYVSGWTCSGDFPTTDGAFMTSPGGVSYPDTWDAFASKIVAPCDLTTDSTAGGSVTDPGEGTFTYEKGTVVDLVATTDAGYQFVEWTGDVGTIADVNAATTTITMNGDYSITADFEEISSVQYDLSINSTEGGSVTTPGEGTFNYTVGIVVDLVATPDAGYRFVEWTGEVDTIADVNAAATNVTMNSGYSITASFMGVEAGGVGIKADDWIKLNYTFTGWPAGQTYPEWLKFEFLSVEGTIATVRFTQRISDGTEQSDTAPVDVVSGIEVPGLAGIVISANLTTGDSVYIAGYGNVTIEGEATKTYAGANRTVVYASFSQNETQVTYYWDKLTGVMVEVSSTSPGFTATAKATETNMWEATEAITVRMPWWPWIIVAVVAVGLVIFFLRRRRAA